MEERNVRFDVPIWHKLNLSIEEAAKYSGIGRAKLYEMTNREDCPFVLWVESRRLIKRKMNTAIKHRIYLVRLFCDIYIRSPVLYNKHLLSYLHHWSSRKRLLFLYADEG